MNILISVGDLEEILGASNKIAIDIAEALSLRGHTCIVAGKSNFQPQCKRLPHGTQLIRFISNDFISQSIIDYENFVRKNNYINNRRYASKRYICRHPLKAIAVAANRHFYKVNLFVKKLNYRREIDSIAKMYNINFVLCVQEPFWAELCVFKNHSSYSRLVYQVDPGGLQTIKLPMSQLKRIRLETKVFSKADHIFTTPILLKQYSANEHYIPFLEKMTAVEFPNIQKPLLSGNSIFNFDKNYINIIYSGMIYDDYRDPTFFLSLIEYLIKSGVRIRCYFLGDICGTSVSRFQNTLPNNVFTHEKVPLHDSFATMNEADFLLNIGNSIENMVPSKIFDYFSTGKPIINMQSIKNCPAIPYFNNYPLQISFKPSSDKIQSSEQLLNFLITFQNKKIPFENVLNQFSTATPDYIATQLENVLERILL